FFSCLFLSPPPRFSLFPYTTLFRSEVELVGADAKLGDDFVSRAPAAFAFIDPALPVGQASACQVEQNQNERAARNRDLAVVAPQDRKSTRLNSSHVKISYAVFCLKK